MPMHKFKSSYQDEIDGKIDPDCWLTSKDATLSVSATHDDTVWVVTMLWVRSPNKFVATVYNKMTDASATAADRYWKTALSLAKTQAGMP